MAPIAAAGAGRWTVRSSATTLALLALAATPAAGQVDIEARDADIRVGGRVHAQMVSSSAEGGNEADFILRRARLTFDVTVSDFLDGRIQPDFEKSTIRLKDAYFRLNFNSAFRVSVGNLKRAFDIFQLVSSTQIPVIERDGEIPGLSDCAGPDGTCSFGRFSEDLDYSDRDAGVRVDGALDDRVSYMVTVTNGTGGATPDENGAKSFAGRVVVAAAENVRVAANVSVHDYDAGVAFGDKLAAVWGGDVEVGDYDGGMHFIWGVMFGDNWMNLTGPEGSEPDPARLASTQAILSYKHVLAGSPRFEAVEPLLRLSWADPDRGVTGDRALLVTPGVQLFVEGRNKIAANLDVYSPGEGSTELSVKVQTYLYF